MKNVIKMCTAAAVVFFVTKTAANEVFLSNAYGASIIYNLTLKTIKEEKVLGNFATAQLYNTDWPTHPTVLIRTNKYLSRFTDLQPYFDKIDQEAIKHPREDAYIYIKPSSLYQGWDISIDWQSEKSRRPWSGKVDIE